MESSSIHKIVLEVLTYNENIPKELVVFKSNVFVI